MTDKAIVVFWSKETGKVSPMVTFQDHGSRVPDLLATWWAGVLVHKENHWSPPTLAVAAASFVWAVCEILGEPPGIESPGHVQRNPLEFGASDYWEERTPGYAGVVLVEHRTGAVKCYGGYLHGESIETLHNPSEDFAWRKN